MKGKDVDNLENILLDLEDVENGAMISLSQEEIESLQTILENLKNSISKDKIKEIFQFYIERDSLFNDDAHKMAVIRLKDVFQELLEEK